ncbi:MAG: HEAT repeat domain-containing protein [Chloroflexota bacterium]
MSSNLPGRLGSKNPQKRLASLKDMVSQSDPLTHEILLACLNDEASIIRLYAATQLVALYDGKYARRLVPLLNDDSVVSQQVIKSLRSTDLNIAQVILAFVDSTLAPIRAGCASILGVYPSEQVVNVLIDLLQDPDVRPRVNAAQSLGEIGDKAAILPLLHAVDDRSDLVGRAAIRALGDIKDPSVVDLLVNRLSVEENRLRKQSILYALGELGNPQAARPLLDLFLQPQESEKMRDSAALALTFLGDEGRKALRTALTEGDAFAQQFAKAYLRL